MASAPSPVCQATEGEQRRGRRHVAGPRQPGQVGPQPQVRAPVLGLHPRPGVVADAQLAQRDGEPGRVLGADLLTVAVAADGVAHRHLPEGGR